MELKRGDDDGKSIWAGTELNVVPIYNVKSLQRRLHAIGVYSDKIDGDFGANTEKAVKLFQWCLRNAVHVVKKSSLLVCSPSPATQITGRCDETTQSKLETWIKNQFTVTGDLVRISTTHLSNIELNPNFTPIGQPVVGKTEFVISRTVVPMVKLMNQTAKKLNVVISINQVLRILGNKVTDSVVPPAAKSQHYIGHAIDCNIVDGSSWNTASDFKNKKQTNNADLFIDAMKKGNYRWGGDFTLVDTPHFDKQLDSNTFDYDAKFFLNQKQITSGDPIEKLLIP
jgi:hypothetical protein